MSPIMVEKAAGFDQLSEVIVEKANGFDHMSRVYIETGVGSEDYELVFEREFLYALTTPSRGRFSLYSIDRKGVVTTISNRLVFPLLSPLGYGFAKGPGGLLYITANQSNLARLYSVNKKTGIITSIGNSSRINDRPDNSSSTGLAINSIGQAYGALVASNNRLDFYSIDLVTGIFTPIRAQGLSAGNGVGLAFDSNDTLYAGVISAINRLTIYEVNTSTGVFSSAFTVIVDSGSDAGVGLACKGSILYAATIPLLGRMQLYSIDLSIARTSRRAVAIGNRQIVSTVARAGIGLA